MKSGGIDFIGDIHGCGKSLLKLLDKLGYQKQKGVYRHPSRTTVFIGDILDRGPNIRLALNTVREMVDAGQAQLLMGNHEYNVLTYLTPSKNTADTFLREHNARNSFIVRETIEQFDPYPCEWRDHLAWIAKLPLFLETERFRAVHACWDQAIIHAFRKEWPDRMCMDENFLHRSVERRSFEGQVVERLLRGASLKLPDNRSVTAKDGFVRHYFRTKYWLENPRTYGDILFQPDPLPKDIANKPVSDKDRQRLVYYAPKERPLFVGHYWMQGSPMPIRSNIMCLDYSAVKYGKLVAYRFDGERALDQQKITYVEVKQPQDDE